jgi:endonuclease G
MQGLDRSTLKHSLEGLEKAMRYYFQDPNISYIDIGYKIKDSLNHTLVDDIAVRVHVRKKLYGEEFERFKALYPEREITKSKIGFTVDVPESQFRMHHHSYRSELWLSPGSPIRRHELLCGGLGISNRYPESFGTLGGKVCERSTGTEMILSNWHVFAGSRTIYPGEPIYQPAIGYGGDYWSDHIAYFSRSAMNQNIDAAVAQLNGRRKISNNQKYCGTVVSVNVPALGSVVIKSGASSLGTTGRIVGIYGRYKYDYFGFNTIMESVFSIMPLDGIDKLSSGGDSGSWWIEKESHKAVGLHFAGSDDPEYALAISMPVVLDALNVDIVAEE